MVSNNKTETTNNLVLPDKHHKTQPDLLLLRYCTKGHEFTNKSSILKTSSPEEFGECIFCESKVKTGCTESLLYHTGRESRKLSREAWGQFHHLAQPIRHIRFQCVDGLGNNWFKTMIWSNFSCV